MKNIVLKFVKGVPRGGRVELLNTIDQEIVHMIFEVLKYCICINQTFQIFFLKTLLSDLSGLYCWGMD